MNVHKRRRGAVMLPSKPFRAWLLAHMAASDLETKQVAGLCGVSERLVYRWRKGEYPSITDMTVEQTTDALIGEPTLIHSLYPGYRDMVTV